MTPTQQQEAGRMMSRIMIWSAIVTVVVAIVLGALVWTPLYAIAAFAIVDLLIARGYATGRLGGGGGRLGRPEEGGVVFDDPSHNPYARED